MENIILQILEVVVPILWLILLFLGLIIPMNYIITLNIIKKEGGKIKISKEKFEILIKDVQVIDGTLVIKRKDEYFPIFKMDYFFYIPDIGYFPTKYSKRFEKLLRGCRNKRRKEFTGPLLEGAK